MRTGASMMQLFEPVWVACLATSWMESVNYGSYAISRRARLFGASARGAARDETRERHGASGRAHSCCGLAIAGSGSATTSMAATRRSLAAAGSAWAVPSTGAVQLCDCCVGFRWVCMREDERKFCAGTLESGRRKVARARESP